MTIAERELQNYNKDLFVKIRNPEDKKIYNCPVRKFIEHNIRIKDKDGNVVRLILTEDQVALYKEICEQKRRGERIRLNILKARQLGFSTFIAAIYLTLTFLVPNQRAVIVADKAENATNIFEIYKFMYENLPERIKQLIPKEASNAKELSVSYGKGMKSSIRIVVADDNAGRGSTCQYLHLSEVAFWKDIKPVIQSLVQTVSATNPNSMIIFETTANGVNEYKEMYDKAVGGSTAYKALFYAWFTNPSYKLPYTNFELLEHEKSLVESLNLSLDQIAWYRYKLDEVNGDLDTLRQEYPSTPLEAFITSGHSYFAADLIQKRKAELIGKQFPRYEFIWDRKIFSEQGDAITIVNPRLQSMGKTGIITIFKEVQDGHPYIVNVDPNMGGEDYFVAQVFDNHDFEQVAILAVNKNSDFSWLSLQVYCLARYYNNALLNAECNNTTGVTVLQTAAMCGHDFIYQDSSVETLSTRYEDKFGYKTKTTNREYMCNLVEAAFRDKYDFINDYDTLCEMENFQSVKTQSGKEKLEATGGSHDDRVTALFGIFLARSKMLQTTLINEKAVSRELTLSELEDRLYRKQTQKQQERRNVFVVWD